jgi:hypothetical protein
MPETGAKTQKDRHMRPENKDNLDSRKNEEQDVKGDDITHNKKEHKNEKAWQKNKDQ